MISGNFITEARLELQALGREQSTPGLVFLYLALIFTCLITITYHSKTALSRLDCTQHSSSRIQPSYRLTSTPFEKPTSDHPCSSPLPRNLQISLYFSVQSRSLTLGTWAVLEEQKGPSQDSSSSPSGLKSFHLTEPPSCNPIPVADPTSPLLGTLLSEG